MSDETVTAEAQTFVLSRTDGFRSTVSYVEPMPVEERKDLIEFLGLVLKQLNRKLAAETTPSPSEAVSSWGFSGYITVLPKENKESKDTSEKPPSEAFG